jgi:hypothetical protein
MIKGKVHKRIGAYLITEYQGEFFILHRKKRKRDNSRQIRKERSIRHYITNLEEVTNTLIYNKINKWFERPWEQNMKVTERRIVRQEWYETELSKTGWDSHGWWFRDDGGSMSDEWTIVKYLHLDKFGNPWIGIAEKETTIGQWLHNKF